MTRAVLSSLAILMLTLHAAGAEPRRPNVLLIVTDDQGYGDLGCHGNLKIKTPTMDSLARDGVRFRSFYVSPVCSPTRASLMTGRYNYRTGVVDTFLGRSMMHPDEVTLPQMLGEAGYKTGIFGKWHLGDNYPLRPIDRGFQEALVIRGGGLVQPADPPEGNSYFDPMLMHNGRWEKAKGYCSDVFTDAAMKFIGDNHDRPFFCYLAYNCPHVPLQVPDKDAQPYLKMNLAFDQFPKIGHPLPGTANQEETAKVYGMIANIDDNLGRLFAKLAELKLAEDTLVVFLSDNGPQQVRWVAGMKARKGSTYEGGIHVPCFVRWPGTLPAGREVEQVAAHIDIAPTLLEACGVTKPGKVAFDGKSLWPLLKGDKVDWPDRTLYFQWHRGDEPELNRACAARSQRYKLVQPVGPTPMKPGKVEFELYDMEKDPLEEKNIAADQPEVVAAMRKGYEEWFKDVSSTRGYAPPRIFLGAAEENPTLLTRQDWRGPKAGWGPKDLGFWEVQVARAGTFDVTVRFAALTEESAVRLKLGAAAATTTAGAGAKECLFSGLKLDDGASRLEVEIAQGQEKVGATYVEVKRRE
jgi:arylsulfatase A-like enzyme